MVDLNDRFKNLADIDDKVNIVVGTPYPKKKNPSKKQTNPIKKRVISILTENRNSLLGFYLHHEAIFKLPEKYQPERLNEVCWENIQRTADQLEKSKTYNEFRKYSKSQPEETISERVKIIPPERKKQRIGTGTKILTPKQTKYYYSEDFKYY